MTGIKILDVPFEGFAGHVSPHTAYDVLNQNKMARLIDVRTHAEWQFVGVPLLDEDQLSLIEWQSFPSMERNASFVEVVRQAVPDTQVPVFLLCRSGARSMAAARALAAVGYESAYNVASGFEGDPDGAHHRGRVNGWKFENLPWRQA